MPYKTYLPKNMHLLLHGIPEEDQPTNETDFWRAVAGELATMIDYASRAQQPQIVFGEMQKSASQYMWQFFVNDLATPLSDSLNWHGQNTSQWVYAGAIVLQNREVSRHH